MQHAKRPLIIVSAWCTLLILSSVAVAQTPDEETPADETVCDPLKNATPGLYGLCVAYCEAHDCDETDEDTIAQCKTASEKILENYEKKMKAGDPAMPCLAAPCPCFDAEYIAAEIPDNGTEVCTDTGTLVSLEGFDADNCRGIAVVAETARGPRCVRRSFGFRDPPGQCIRTSNTVLDITDAEAQGCRNLLRDVIAQRALVCQ